MSLGINENEDSRQVFSNLMEQIKIVNGLLNNAVALNALATKELSKAENKRIRAQNQEAERLMEEHDRLSRSENTWKEQIAIVDAEIGERVEESVKMNNGFKKSMKSLSSTVVELVREIGSRLGDLDGDLTHALQ